MLMPPGYSPNYPANSAKLFAGGSGIAGISAREPQDNRGMGHRPAPAIRPQDLLPLHIPPPVREHSPRRRMAHYPPGNQAGSLPAGGAYGAKSPTEEMVVRRPH